MKQSVSRNWFGGVRKENCKKFKNEKNSQILVNMKKRSEQLQINVLSS